MQAYLAPYQKEGVVAQTLDIIEAMFGQYVTLQTRFADLGANSLDILELFIDLEEKFEVSVEIPYDLPEDFGTVGIVVGCVLGAFAELD